MRVISHPSVFKTHPLSLIHLSENRSILSKQILTVMTLLIASLTITLAQAERLNRPDTATPLEQDTTTVYEPICPHGFGPLYFSTLLAGRSGPYLSRTQFTLFNGTELEAEGELIIETSGGDFEMVEVVHFCTELCSFELTEGTASFRLPPGAVLTVRLQGVGSLWTGWAELTGDACARSILQMAETTEDPNGTHINYLIRSNLVAEIELLPTHGSKKYAFPVTQYLSGKGLIFWSAYAIVNTSSSNAEVRLTGVDDDPFTIELAPGERVARYTARSVTATLPAVGDGRAEIESNQPLAVTALETRNWFPFLSTPIVEFKENEVP